MPTVTVSELVDRAKAAADMRDNFVTPKQWEYWASQERLALDLFLARSGWPLALETLDITITGLEEDNAYLVNPAGGVMAIVCVHQMNNNADQFRLVRHQNSANFSPDSRPMGNPVEYRVIWSADALALSFYPRPKVGDKFLVTYLPHPFRLNISDPSIYATTPVGGLTALNKPFFATALAAGAIGNNIEVKLTNVNAAPGVTTGSAQLIVDSSAEVNVQFLGGDSLGAPLATPTTWAQIYAAYDGSAFIRVDHTNTGSTNADNFDDFTSGGIDAVTLARATQVTYPMGWEERIVLGMARRALIKEESETRAIDSEIALWESRIEESAWSRVLSESPTVRNSDMTNYAWTDRYSVPPYTYWFFV